MTQRKIHFSLLFLICIIIVYSGCRGNYDGDSVMAGRLPVIEPDYSYVTIPHNISPMNFMVMEDADHFMVEASSGNGNININVKSSDGKIFFPEKKWKRLLEDSGGDRITIQVFASEKGEKKPKHYEPFEMYVSIDPVDPWLAYRLIHPGYYNWSNIRIMQRSVESFELEPVVDNRILDMNCVNCHSFNNNNPGKFMIHIRGSHGGTYFVNDGNITKRDPKIDAMPGGATYPAWHPGGRFIAFSSNQVRQGFYANPQRSIEVFDLVSTMTVYDLEKNEVVLARERDTNRYLQTFPSWSPDGKYLYYCRALQINPGTSMTLDEIKQTRYDLVRIKFDAETITYGETEMVYNASGTGKSASLPRISPDGKYLIFTLADYGTFPIWHREADLFLLDLQTGEAKRMDINSSDNESYHSWSSNGRWLVFSSKRTDGRSTRPFLAYFNSWDSTGKPFILPQEDPEYYDRLMESFNIPEFVSARIMLSPHDFAAVANNETLKAVAGNPLDSLHKWEMKSVNTKRNPGEKSIHE